MFEGGVGAAASLYRGKVLQKSLTFHLGSDLDHTAYEAEIVGLILGAHLLNTLSCRLICPAICLNSQASIHALDNLKPHPAHYLIDLFHDATKALKKKEQTKHNCDSEPLTLHIVWTPGHEGIPENELVDSLAKEAATGKSSPARSLPPSLCKPLPHSTSAIKQNLTQKISQLWKDSWMSSP
jgi:ribonuclease HI